MSSNSDDRTVERRLAAVERAVDGREQMPGDVPSADAESLEHRLDELEGRVDELDAALQAVRGFLGGIDAVNEAVESRADAAIAAVDRLERRLEGADGEGTQSRLEPQQREKPANGEASAVAERTCDAEHEAPGRGPNEPDTEGVESGTDKTVGGFERTLRDRLSEQW